MVCDLESCRLAECVGWSIKMAVRDPEKLLSKRMQGRPDFFEGQSGQCSTYVMITSEIKSSRDSNISPLQRPGKHLVKVLESTHHLLID